MIRRELIIRLDGQRIARGCGAYLSGEEALGLFPAAFMLMLRGLSTDTLSRLLTGGELTVSARLPAASDSSGGETLLASGTVLEVYPLPGVPGAAEISFARGLRFRDSRVSLSVPAGLTVSATVRQLLAAGGDTPLAGFSGEDPVFPRPQAFHGRTADAVRSVLSACGARAALTPAGLAVIPAGGLPETLRFGPEYLTAEPFLLRSGAVVRTLPLGIPLGVCARFRGRSAEAAGLVVRQRVEVDTEGGPWYAELELESAPPAG